MEEAVDVQLRDRHRGAELPADVHRAATSSHITAAFTAVLASAPMEKTPWLRMSTALDRWPRSVSTMPRPIESSPISANGPTGTSPPNSSAIMVSTHGIGSARADQAVA